MHELRSYQLEALEEIGSAFAEGRRRLLLVLPTGTGKTVVISHMLRHPAIKEWLDQHPPARRKMLVLAHREELLDQAAAHISQANPDLLVDIEQGPRRARPDADVVVASVATIGRAQSQRLRALRPSDFRMVVVDEAHHATATSYVNVLRYFGLIPPPDFKPANVSREDIPDRGAYLKALQTEWARCHSPDIALLGVTATPERNDNVGLWYIFDEIVYARSLREMITRRYLAPLRAYRVETTESIDAVHVRGGDFIEQELSRAVNISRRNDLIIQAYKDLAADRKALVFAVDVAHAQRLAAAFREQGVEAECVVGSTPADERRELISRFKRGALRVLTNCMVLTEGFDCPDVSCIVHARPTHSSLLYRQMTGRGTRRAPGKVDCLVLDVVDVTLRHQLVTIPSLFGLPPDFDADGEVLSELAERREYLIEKGLDVSAVQSADDLVVEAHEVSLWENSISALGWFKTGLERYRVVTGGPDREHLGVTRVAGGWRVRLRWRVARHPPPPQGFLVVGRYSIEEPLTGLDAPVFQDAFDTLEHAIRHADFWIRKYRSGEVPARIAAPPRVSYVQGGRG